MTAVDAVVPGPGSLPEGQDGGTDQVVDLTAVEDPSFNGVTPRDRLLRAGFRVFARLGYEKATIADIVREARVSRRTFYEHFDDKRDCLFATYDVGTGLLVATVTETVIQGRTWQERLLGGIDVFVEKMLVDPDVTRVMVTEVMAAGHDAVARRRQAHRQWAMMWVREYDDARARDAALREQTRVMSLSEAQVLVAAIQELVMLAIEEEAEPDRAAIAQAVRKIIVAMAVPSPEAFTTELELLDDQRHPS